MFQNCGVDLENQVHYEVDPNTVGQYTGLHDMDGKEIYESDVYRDTMGRIGVVQIGIFKDTDTDFDGEEYEEEDSMYGVYLEVQGKTYAFNVEFTSAFIRTIGNIHDNMKQLEGKDG